MPDTFQFFHICDHTFKQTEEDGEVREFEIYHSPSSQSDLIENGARVLDILEVRALEYNDVNDDKNFLYDDPFSDQTYDDPDKTDSIYDDTSDYLVDFGDYFDIGASRSRVLPSHFYEQYLHNRIKWNVAPPIKYAVRARVLYTNIPYKKVRLEDCPRCQGKGWFVDVLDQNQDFLDVEGTFLIAQQFVKDLLTRRGSNFLDESYGTFFYKDVVSTSSSEEELYNNVRLAISEVEDDYIEKQNRYIDDLQDDEILEEVQLNKVKRMKGRSTAVLIELEFVTTAGNRNFRLAF